MESDVDTVSMKSAISGVSAINMIKKVGNRLKTSTSNIMAFSILGITDKDESEANISSLVAKSPGGISGNNLRIPGPKDKQRIPMGKKFSSPVLPNSFISRTPSLIILSPKLLTKIPNWKENQVLSLGDLM